MESLSELENVFQDIPVIEQPEEIKVPLYQHQLASVYQMEKREREKNIIDGNNIIDLSISIQADSAGYGKTLSLITLIHRDKMDWDVSEQYIQTSSMSLCDGRIKKTNIKYYEKLDVTLVLVSQSIINQWYSECQKSPLCVKKITTRKDIDEVLIVNYDVILVTPTMYNDLVFKYNGMAWKRFIFDEPGSLKISKMHNIIAGFIWLVTATPTDILSRHKHSRNSFMSDLVYSNFLQYTNYIIIKNNDNFINYSFRMPVTHHNYYKCFNPVYKAVQGFVSDKITEMISAGNISGAIKELGGDVTQNITELVKKKKIEEIDELEAIIQILEVRGRNKQAEVMIEKVVRLKSQIDELNSRYKDILEGDCNICYEKLENPIMEPNCQNIFCGKCLLKWLENKTTCPLCRETIQKNKLVYIDTEQKEEMKTHYIQKEEKLKTKIETIVSLIKGKPQGKFIIFSAWDQTFLPIRNMLIDNNINYIEVKGAISTREKNIMSFKNGDTSVIFLNSDNNGSGINLQEATDLIVYHEMSSTTLNQIIGRANRIGRVNSLQVHHLQI